MRRAWIFALTGSAAAAACALTLGVPAAAFADTPYPLPNGRCVDNAGVLGDDLCQRITEVLTRDEARYGDEIAVAVVPTIGGAAIESWATGLFNSWGVGKAKQDNGVLLVVAVNDHTLRIATGRGMGDRLSDGQASEIIGSTITPEFKQNRYPQGILAGMDAIRTRLGHQFTDSDRLADLATAAPAPVIGANPGADAAANVGAGPDGNGGADSAGATEEESDDAFAAALPIIGVGVLILAILGFATARRSRGGGGPVGRTGRRGRSGGGIRAAMYSSPSDASYSSSSSWGSSSSDSSGGFGGGGSDGGGSSGSW